MNRRALRSQPGRQRQPHERPDPRDERDELDRPRPPRAARRAGQPVPGRPERNRGDLDDVPQEVRDAMKFHFAMTVDEVLGAALESAPVPSAT